MVEDQYRKYVQLLCRTIRTRVIQNVIEIDLV
jgi:hypothetical protein